LLYSDRIITLRASGLWNLVPGEIVTVNPHKQWRYGGHPYLSGEIESARLDVAALDLKPLRLQELGIWNPDEHYWGEEDAPIQEWAKPIIARGSRPQFELEQVLPGADPADPFADPITEANDLKDAGDLEAARRRLMELCESDLRCLDAHAHLGNLVFDHGPKEAVRHYEVGVRIGELSLGDGFDGLLPWGLIDNRPLLRCMHGYGLCLWRLGRQPEARHIFDRMLWLNPADNQGVRFLIADIQNRRTWEKCQDA
jgi:tetratricopeptide (TPR) repeat protein